MSMLVDAAAGWIAAGPPAVRDCTHLLEEGVRGVFLDGATYRGRPTRVFAWIGVPAGATAARQVPGVVLVHGGGGTAFARWVRFWNRRGYAAIAVDTCGAMPLPDTGIIGSADWPRHSYSGPPGWGAFDQSTWEPKDQWIYHACAAVVRAHSVLASLPEVDTSRIGITGVSWGGFLTCLVAGIDDRFACAAPVYGCGFVTHESTWVSTGAFDRMTGEAVAYWRDNWDPASVLSRVGAPMLWLNGTNDFAYWPPVWQRSAASTLSARHLCLKLRWPHGHIPEAEEAREIGAFFDAQLNGAVPLLTVSAPAVSDGTILVSYGSERPLRHASLLCTVDGGQWPGREWHHMHASIHRAEQQISAVMPHGTTAACISALSDDYLTTTSDLVFTRA